MRAGTYRTSTALLLVTVLLSLVYYATAPLTKSSHDPFSNTLTAWSIGTRGSVVLDEFAFLLGRNEPIALAAIVHGQAGPVSFYPPGAALLAAPLYAVVPYGNYLVGEAVFPDQSTALYVVPPLGPAAIVAALTTALAALFLYLAFQRLGSRRASVAAAAIFAFGTGAWAVSSQALWQHGPAMMWIAIGVAFVDVEQRRGSDLAWMMAILTRPITGAIVAGLHGYRAWTKRQWRLVLAPWTAAAIGVTLLATFNRYVFGSWSIQGGYGHTSNVRIPNIDLLRWGGNMVGALIDPARGLLTISPFLVILVPGLTGAWKTAPSWVKGAAVGGILYFLVQYNLHDFRGGLRFFGYRYPLEALVAWSPLLFMSYQAWVKGTRHREILFWCGVAIAVSLQAYGVANPYAF